MNYLKLSTYLNYCSSIINAAAERDKERYRLALLTSLSSLLSKCATIFVMFFSVRIALPYLGVERFGIWMLIASFVGLLSFLDFGIGNTLVNRVAMLSIPSYQRSKSSRIGASLLVLAIISIFMGIFLYLIAEYFPWHLFLKVSSPDLYVEIHKAIKVFVIFFSLNIFGGGVNKIFLGLQRGYEANFFNVFGSLISLPVLWIVISTDGGLSAILAASMFGATLTNFLLLMLLVYRGEISRRHLKMNLKVEASHLLKFGRGFFLLQIGAMAIYAIDNIIIAGALGVIAVATYTITQRLFQFAIQPFVIMNSGLWPAYANARAHGDKSYIAMTLKRSMIITIAGSTFTTLVLLIFGKTLILWWTHNEISVSYYLLCAFAFWAVIDASANSFSTFLNGTSQIGSQVKVAFTLIFIGLPLKFILLSCFGLEGMLIGSTLFFLANNFFWHGIIYKKLTFSVFI